jgi:hypothetical protein
LLSLRLRHISEESPDPIRQWVARNEELARYDAPGLNNPSARFQKRCGTRIAIVPGGGDLSGGKFETLENSPRIASMRGTIGAVAHRWPHLPSHGALCGVCGNALRPKLGCESASPSAQGRFAYIQPLAVFANRSHDQVHVWVVLVSVQDHEVSVFKRKLLACKVSACGKKLF